MKSLSTRQRQALYEVEAERAKLLGSEFPCCNLCSLPIRPGQAWDVSHDAHKPRAMGGTEVGLAHRRCNRMHGSLVVTPLMAKLARIRKKHLDIRRSSQPLPGGRFDRLKKTMRGEVVLRATGERA